MPEGKSEIPTDVMALAEETCRQNEYSPTNFDGTPSTVCVTLCKAIVADRQRDQWLPIETAPKDGTDIIVYNPSGEGIVGEAYYSNDNGRGGWWWAGTYEGEHMEEPMHIRNAWPTHWQPLPAPPSSTEER